MKKKLVILTGAGMSAESGIATFRDSGGLWEQHPVEQVATPEGFAANPELVQKFYNQRRRELLSAKPTRAYWAGRNGERVRGTHHHAERGRSARKGRQHERAAPAR